MFPRPDEIDWRFINLSHRTDRLEHVTKQLSRAGISATRFNARTKEEYDGHPENIQLMLGTPNTIGNWLSHTELWKLAADTGKYVGVLEDDALICSDFVGRLNYVHDTFDQPWDILFLGSTYHVNPPVWHADDLGRDFELTDTKYVHRVYGAFSNQGYVIHPDNAMAIYDAAHAIMKDCRGSDHALIKLQPKFNCFVFTPGMVFQIDGQSDIGMGVTRFSHFLETLGPYVWCDRLEDFDYDSYDWAEGVVR